MGVQLHAPLNSTLAAENGQNHAPADLSPGIEPPSSIWIENCVDTRAFLDPVAKRKISCLCRELNIAEFLGCRVHSLVVILSYPGFLTKCILPHF
jgi:hypothetical protein